MVIPSSLAHVKPRTVTIALIVIAAAWMGFWAFYTLHTNKGGDFYAYFLAADSVRHGHDPYATPIAITAHRGIALGLPSSGFALSYRYPPLTAVALQPLLGLSPRQAAAIWLTLNIAAMIAAVIMTGVALGGGWRTPAALTLLILSFPAADTMLCGQINGLLFACMAGALLALTRQRNASGGGLLALGAAVKVTPLALILYLGWRRRWRSFAWSSACLVVITLLVAAAGGLRLTAEYVQHAWRLSETHNSMFTPINQTITGTVGRLLGGSLVAIGRPPLQTTVGLVLSLLLAACTAALCWPRGSAARWLTTEYALVATALVLVPTFSWYHQTVTLILPIMVVGELLIRRRRWGWLAALAALYVLADLNQIVWYTFIKTLSTTPLWRGLAFPFLLALIIWGLLGKELATGKWAGADNKARSVTQGELGRPREASPGT